MQTCGTKKSNKGVLLANENINAVGGFLKPGANVKPIRGDIVESVKGEAFEEIQKREVKQPDWIPPTIPKHEEIDTAEVFDLKIPDAFNIRADKTVWSEQMVEKSYREVLGNKTNVDQTETNARSVHLNEVKGLENDKRVGLETLGGVSKFMPIESIEGTGPDKENMSKFEIGYGVKIPKSWLTDDESKWPVVQGVSVNIKNGITDEQATAMTKDLLDKSYKSASKSVSGWEKLSEREKSFWADLTYNGGSGAIAKNTKAVEASKKGLTVEAMINVFNFIKAGNKQRRGLLNRRLSMYNQAALSITGAPVASSYEIKDGSVNIQFSNGFMTNKVSKRLADKINGNKKTYTIKAKLKDGSYKVDKNYNFER